MSKYSDEEIIEKFRNFDKDKFSLIVSTTSKDNNPLTNYAPFVKDGDDYFISVSSNLPHFTNMVETSKAHILIIEVVFGRMNVNKQLRVTKPKKLPSVFK